MDFPRGLLRRLGRSHPRQRAGQRRRRGRNHVPRLRLHLGHHLPAIRSRHRGYRRAERRLGLRWSRSAQPLASRALRRQPPAPSRSGTCADGVRCGSGSQDGGRSSRDGLARRHSHPHHVGGLRAVSPSEIRHRVGTLRRLEYASACAFRPGPPPRISGQHGHLCERSHPLGVSAAAVHALGRSF